MTTRDQDQWRTVLGLSKVTMESLAQAIGLSIKATGPDDEMIEVPRAAALSMAEFFVNMSKLMQEIEDDLVD